MMKTTSSLANLLILLAILVVVNLISSRFYGYLDLTEDQRYTLTDSTKKLLEKTDDNYYVTVYLEGTFPASMKRFRDRIEETLKQFQSETSYINYEFVDPIDGTPEQVKLMEKNLVDKRLYPTTINYFDGEENIIKPIFPYAVFKYFNKEVQVNLLDVEGITNYSDETLNVAEGVLEYKFANAMSKLQLKEKPIIAFTTGNGELEVNQIASLNRQLRKYYRPVQIDLDTMYNLTSIVDLVIVAAPQTAFSPRNQFMLDQYVMSGGKVLWLIEEMDIRLDSIAFGRGYVPPLIDHGLDNLFFKYGFKILDNTILDLESTSIPQIVGNAGGTTQMDMFKYYYHPLISSTSDHPISKNIDRVNMFFPSTIDTVVTATNIKKTFLLRSSPYSRYQLAPLSLDFRMLGVKPQVSKFNKGEQPVALLLEGKFESAYKNRLTEEQNDALKSVGRTFLDESPLTSMIVISDADFTKNLFNPENNNITPLGFNKWERKVYSGNKDLILNAVEYLLDQDGILASRAKEFQMRLLDEQEVTNRKMYWQSLNIAFPLISLTIFGLLFYFVRRYRFSKKRIAH